MNSLPDQPLTRRNKILMWSVWALFSLGVFLNGCSKKASGPSVAIDTGRLLPAYLIDVQIRGYLSGKNIGVGSFTPDAAYAEVNSAWLPGFFERFKNDLFVKGVVKWDTRFDCNKFAAAYCAAAQMEYFRDRWGEHEAGPALAVAEVWYSPDEAKQDHAIVLAITNRGAEFIEPQTGKRLFLSDTELRSMRFRRF